MQLPKNLEKFNFKNLYSPYAYRLQAEMPQANQIAIIRRVNVIYVSVGFFLLAVILRKKLFLQKGNLIWLKKVSGDFFFYARYLSGIGVNFQRRNDRNRYKFPFLLIMFCSWDGPS